MHGQLDVGQGSKGETIDGKRTLVHLGGMISAGGNLGNPGDFEALNRIWQYTNEGRRMVQKRGHCQHGCE